jgi:hypothetical protein
VLGLDERCQAPAVGCDQSQVTAHDPSFAGKPPRWVEYLINRVEAQRPAGGAGPMAGLHDPSNGRDAGRGVAPPEDKLREAISMIAGPLATFRFVPPAPISTIKIKF